MTDLADHTPRDLLRLHAGISDELRRRGLVRSANNPVGDFAEYLFCRAFGWQQAGSSEKGYDARDAVGLRYQIKARRLHQHNSSRQLSALRRMADRPFDILAAVLFTADFDVSRAAMIPISVVLARTTNSAHTNSDRFILGDDVWQVDGVTDVTTPLRMAIP
jgi:hypothetical protein